MSTDQEILVVEQIGEGGQGVVHKAIFNEQFFAIKTFRPPAGVDEPDLENYRHRFRREIEITSRLNHRNIVEVLMDHLNSDTPFYMMEWAETNLDSIIKNNPKGLPAKDAISLFIEICQGMAFAHQNDALHRDLKPENVLIVSGVPKIADFGLGRSLDSETSMLTQSALGWGTVHYMAPEQITSLHHAGKPADVYALGIILFQLTTGQQPHLARMNGDNVPSELRFIVSKCLRDKPSDRYGDACQLLKAMEGVLDSVPSRQLPPKQQAELALHLYQEEDDLDAIDELGAILHTYQSDSQLYRLFLPKLPVGVLKKLPNLAEVVQVYDAQYAAGNSTFDYADDIAKFYEKCLQVITSLDIRRMIFTTFLDQAYRNNRFFVGDRFAAVCNSAWGDQAQANLIAEVLANNPASHEFIRSYLKQYSMPPIVMQVLEPPDPF